MKKLLTTILLLALFLPQTVASAVVTFDLASLSDEELCEVINECRIELSSRRPDDSSKITIAKNRGIEIYLDRHFQEFENYEGKKYVALGAAVVNGSNSPIYIYDKGCCLNGWRVDTTITLGDIPAGKSKKVDINLCLDDAGIASFDDVTDIDFAFEALSVSDFSTIAIFEPYTFVK